MYEWIYNHLIVVFKFCAVNLSRDLRQTPLLEKPGREILQRFSFLTWSSVYASFYLEATLTCLNVNRPLENCKKIMFSSHEWAKTALYWKHLLCINWRQSTFFVTCNKVIFCFDIIFCPCNFYMIHNYRFLILKISAKSYKKPNTS